MDVISIRTARISWKVSNSRDASEIRDSSSSMNSELEHWAEVAWKSLILLFIKSVIHVLYILLVQTVHH
jgi:hypothetical protein